MKTAFSLGIDANGIATLQFDHPDSKANAFSSAALLELEAVLDRLKAETAVKALRLISAKPNIFIAGADIEELAAIKSESEAEEKALRGQAIFSKLNDLPFPTIAGIDGACLGGGLECVLACDYRVVSDNPSVKLGLPEVTLGIIPGWGGTQRLPRLIGLPESLKLILTGKSIDGRLAQKIGLADRIVSSSFFATDLDRFTDEILSQSGRDRVLSDRKRSILDKLVSLPCLRSIIVFKKSRQMVLERSHGHYPAPEAALDIIQKTFAGSLKRGLEREAKAFSKLCVTPICKNLVQLFFTNEALKKENRPAKGAPSKTVKSAAVLGAGVMGGGISWLFSQNHIPVRMKDLDWKPILKGFAEANDYYQELVKRRKLKAGEVPLHIHRITGSTDFSGFQNVDIVVEAVIENLEIKKMVLAESESLVGPNTIIATNTSSLSLVDLASSLQRPERFVGMHFFNPVNRMPLVEIVAGPQTSSETITIATELTRRLGKTPILVNDCSGFLVNRILIPYLNEAALMLQEGGSLVEIDRVVERFGMPMGPFLLADEVGIDVGLKVAKTLEAAYGDRMRVAALLEAVYEEHHLLGKKGGKGFYIHNGESRTPNSEIDSIIKAIQGKNETAPITLSSEQIIDRAFLMMVNESARCLEESIVSKPEYLDMAMILGTGFPPFRGGPLRYADSRGLTDICRALDRLQSSVGDRFSPAPLLMDMEKASKSFYNY